MNTLPFPTSDGVPYYNNTDASNNLTMPMEQHVRNDSNIFVPVNSTNPLAVRVAELEALVGELTDAAVDAGATGSLSAKLRRVSTDINALLTKIGEVQVSPTENTVLERLKALETALAATLDVQLSGSLMEYYGATIATRPEATVVPTGAIFKAVDTSEFWQSNGTEWVVLV